MRTVFALAASALLAVGCSSGGDTNAADRPTGIGGSGMTDGTRTGTTGGPSMNGEPTNYDNQGGHTGDPIKSNGMSTGTNIPGGGTASRSGTVSSGSSSSGGYQGYGH